MRDPSSPTLSVVIAARNAGNFLGATLDSIAAQSSPPDQVVIYDDGSTDNTASIANSYADRIACLNVITGNAPAGISAARNRANSVATSDYIAVLDADDLFATDAVEMYRAFLVENPDTDLIYADTSICDAQMRQGKPRRYPRFDGARDAIRRTLGSPLIPFKHSSMVYRTKAIQAVGGYDETLPIKVDVELFLRFHASGMRVAKLDRTTSLHRKHRGQISARRLCGIQAYRRLLLAYEPNPLARCALLAARVPSEFLKMLLRG
jgi:glycosyltransferase involved in cell wall biosynthesis